MNIRDFTKSINENNRDLEEATELEYDRISEAAETPPAKDDKKPRMSVKEMEGIVTEMARRCSKVKNLFKDFHDEFDDLEKEKKQAAATAPKKGPAPTVNTDRFESASDKLEKGLEGHVRWIRAELIGRAEFTDQYERAVTGIFNSLKKLETEVDKFASQQLARAVKKEKPMEVTPSKFLAEYRALVKSEKATPVKEIEDKLKRVDSNHEFDKVNPLCEAAMEFIDKVIKRTLDKVKDKDLIEGMQQLRTDIENYDDKMFLLSRMK